VLDRKTDVGRTVNSSMNAPVLFTLVNDLSKMQINAAVAEADVGTIAEGQDVKFTVDAFPNRTFVGKVRMVRNAASTNQSVVSYATIIDVNNDDLKLKPGMTANVSIIVQQRPNVLSIGNGAIRVRIPQELLPKTASAAGGKGGEKGGGGMTDDEKMRSMQEVLRAVGFERGTQASADQIEKAKVLAKEKGLDPDLVAARMAMPGGKKRSSDGGSKGSRGFSGGSSGAGDRGFNNTIITRTLYKLVESGGPEKEKKVEPVSVKLGISDGFATEVLEGLNEGDTIITNVMMPNASAALAAQQGMNNPFQAGRSGFGGSSGMRGPR
jgi:HlyD family secretion protein